MDTSHSMDKLNSKSRSAINSMQASNSIWIQQKRETSTTGGYIRSTRKASIEQTVESTATTAMKSKAYYQTCRRIRYYEVSFLQCFKGHRLSLNTSINRGWEIPGRKYLLTVPNFSCERSSIAEAALSIRVHIAHIRNLTCHIFSKVPRNFIIICRHKKISDYKH